MREQDTWGKTACQWIPPRERDDIIRSCLWSQSLSGVVITYEEAERSLIEAMHKPLLENFG